MRGHCSRLLFQRPVLDDARGLRPLGSKSSDLAPAPPGGRSAPPTPGDFPVAGKVTKGAPRAVPFGIPQGGRFAPPAASRNPLDRVCATDPDGFATLSRWENRTLFLPKLYRGHTSCCQSVARQVPCPRGCRRPFYPPPIPLVHKAGGIQGGPPPCAGGPGTRRFLVSLW